MIISVQFQASLFKKRFDRNDTVFSLRTYVKTCINKNLQGSCKLASFHDVYLIYGGKVISDDSSTLAVVFVDETDPTVFTFHRVADTEPTFMMEMPFGLFPLLGEKEPSSEQDNWAVAEACKCIESFVSYLSEDASEWKPSTQDLLILRGAAAELKSQIYYGDYGCVLLSRETTVGNYHMMLIGLDDWSFEMHGGNSYFTYSSMSRNNTSLPLGFIPIDKFERFATISRELMNLVRKRTGDKRSAARNEQGNQKTPALVHVVLLDALQRTLTEVEQSDAINEQQKESTLPPRGGFTDVGLHTGGKKRNTGWPLVKAVFQILLESSGNVLLYHASMAHLQLLFAEREFFSGLTSGEIVMQMLSCAVQEGLFLADEGHDIKSFEARCVLLRFKLDETANAQAVAYSTRFDLSNVECSKGEEHRLFHLNPPEEIFPLCNEGSLEEARSRASVNLSSLPVTSLALSSWSELKAWVDRYKGLLHRQDALLLVLNTVETFTFMRAPELARQASKITDSLEIIEYIWDFYMSAVDIFHKTASSETLQVLITWKSKELLVSWTLYCMVHSCVKITDPLVGTYRVSLNWNDLQHLVLSEKLAVDACLYVAAYLRANSKAPKPPIFSLLRDDASIDFARCHANSSNSTNNMWKQEEMDMRSRQNSRYEEILQKKAELIPLDKKLNSLQRQLHQLSSELKNLETPRITICGIHLRTSEANDEKYYSTNREIKETKDSITWTEGSIKRTEISPCPILQPLPRSEWYAMPVIFFLQIPANLRILSRFSFSAQQLLLPKTDVVSLPSIQSAAKEEYKIDECIAIDSPNIDWYNYYISLSTARKYIPAKSSLVLGSNGKIPTSNWYNKNVRNVKSAEDGVYYPDDLIPSLFWSGGKCKLFARVVNYFNPFANVEHKAIAHNFSASFNDKSMQWALEQYGDKTPSIRSNWPEAVLSDMVDWCPSKSQYLAAGGLRAFPNQQFRKLCVIFKEGNLQLQDKNVHTLLRQTLCHIGTLSDEETPQLIWRTDATRHNGFKTLREEFRNLSEKLRHKAREYSSILILGESAAIVSQWDIDTREIARDFANSLCSFAEVLEAKSESLLKGREKFSPEKNLLLETEISELRARRCNLYECGIICHCAGKLNVDDVTQLAHFSALSEHCGMLEASNNKARVPKAVTCNILSHRMHEILEIIDENPNILTSAAKLIFEMTPETLVWNRIIENGSLTQCYEAVSQESGQVNLYSLNVQTGVMLFNGLPPQRLPISILSIPLYKHIFSDRNFEVKVDSDGVFTTVRLVDQRELSFFTNNSGPLIIREYDPEHKVTLELLDCTKEGLDSWAGELPIRIQKMHSHWYNRENNIIVSRGLSFSNKDIDFLFYGNKNGWECRRIPDHSKCEEFQKSLLRRERYDEFVYVQNSSIRTVLSKFEIDSGLIHIIRSASSGSLSYELPRFGLCFELSNEGKLRSSNYNGFFMASEQQFTDTMVGFTQYLVLVRPSETNLSKIVIIPAGKVTRGTSLATCYIHGDSSYDTERALHVYQQHPRFDILEVNAGPFAIEARLQLAAIYAAVDSRLPESRSCRTGGEIAVELLRQSIVNVPMTSNARMHLESISRSFGIISPTLPLLCYDLDTIANELTFLYPRHEARYVLEYPKDAAASYIQRKHRNLLSSRAILSVYEELRIFSVKVCHRSTRIVTTELLGIPRTSSFRLLALCKQIECRLCQLTSYCLQDSTLSPSDPLTGYLTGSEIGKRICDDISQSWAEYSNLSSYVLTRNIACVEVIMRELLTSVKNDRETLEKELLWNIHQVTAGVQYSSSFNMRRASNIEPIVTSRDMVKAAYDPRGLRLFNPFLSDEAIHQLQEDILVWLQACVLEDKLGRMIVLATTEKEQELLGELSEIGRKWDVKEYPAWLVFEVEQQLQIRHVQYVVASFILQNPGSITQLNMGEGKTRVILPMLILSLLENSDKLLRVHFLSSLLKEAYDYLHRFVTASLFCRPIYLLPFHRDVHLSVMNVRIMIQCLMRCQASRGFVCVAPEHRLSLQLKWHELNSSGDQQNFVQQELFKFENLPYYDFFDESDELLSFKYQLIYAIGGCQGLPNGVDRWTAAEAVLKQLQNNPKVKTILKKREVSISVSVSELYHSWGAFDKIRLLPGETLDQNEADLLLQLGEGVFDDPPYRMRWLRDHPLKCQMLQFTTKPELSTDWFYLQPGTESLDPQQMSQLLALRGVLACKIALHCLSLRYCVNYGVDPRRGKNRRVAVPYRASDTPCDRAEYAQPETLIMLTILAYYHRGIDIDEALEAVRTLLTLGPKAQVAEYDLWLDQVLSKMTSEQRDALDSVDKLDMSNPNQLRMLHNVFQYNMAVINFWLNNCVFERETMQFPQRLVASAFNLADNSTGLIAGFSGTKDFYMLLPFQVKQREPDEKQIKGTDGKMVDLIGMRDHVVECFPKDSPKPFNESVLEHTIICRKADALIDAGAAMAGLSNLEVAEKVLQLLLLNPSRHKGVVYFDVKKNSWYVMSKERRMWPLGSSPIQERDAFVYFDESRCRGADMKLDVTAMAVLTIGQLMSKDKLMQAAGRMRKLKYGQKLVFAVPSELIAKIYQSNSLDSNAHSQLNPLHVLKWTLENTIEGIKRGLPNWGIQGSTFLATQNPAARKLDENLELDDLYAGKLIKDSVINVVVKHQVCSFKRLRSLGIDHNNISLSEINKVVKAYGSDIEVIATTCDEECERELENEREIEQEVEISVPRQAPVEPCSWDFKQILTSQKPQDLKLAGVMPLSEALIKYCNLNLSSISWDKCGIFVTNNFITSVKPLEGTLFLDQIQYLRPVDALMVFPNNECLLLSEWEADNILKLEWEHSKGLDRASDKFGPRPVFCNFAYLLTTNDNECVQLQVPELQLPARDDMAMSYTKLGLNLFAGGTMFGTGLISAKRKLFLKDRMREILPTPESRIAALQLPVIRGCAHMIPRSDLEDICDITGLSSFRSS